MAKRKAAHANDEADVVSNRRSTRRKTSNEEEMLVLNGKRTKAAHDSEKKRSTKATNGRAGKTGSAKGEDVTATKVTFLRIIS
jgi:hypothetical protein